MFHCSIIDTLIGTSSILSVHTSKQRAGGGKSRNIIWAECSRSRKCRNVTRWIPLWRAKMTGTDVIFMSYILLFSFLLFSPLLFTPPLPSSLLSFILFSPQLIITSAHLSSLHFYYFCWILFYYHFCWILFYFLFLPSAVERLVEVDRVRSLHHLKQLGHCLCK